MSNSEKPRPAPIPQWDWQAMEDRAALTVKELQAKYPVQSSKQVQDRIAPSKATKA